MTETTETSFVYYLMSNASMNVYKDNKPQHFRTLLPSPMILDGDWEVGLSAIIYPHNWNNIKAESMITIQLPMMMKAEKRRIIFPSDIRLPQKQFQDLNDCIKTLNETINASLNEKFFKPADAYTAIALQGTFSYEHLEFALTKSLPQKVYLKNYGYGDLKVELPEANLAARDLWRLLGFEDSVTELKEGDIAAHGATTTLHFPSLYVYTPMIEYVGVGDTRAPLFAMVPIKGKPGEMAYERFDKPIYSRITQKFIGDIEISIKDDTGEDVQFGVGKTILILHFRRRI